MDMPKLMVKMCSEVNADDVSRLVQVAKDLMSLTTKDVQDCQLTTPNDTFMVVWNSEFCAFSKCEADEIYEDNGAAFWNNLALMVELCQDF